jgi:hypothetical protein
LTFYLAAKTEVVLVIKPKVIEKSLVFKIDENKNQVDAENKIIPARSISIEVDGTKSTVATGKKTVGEKAKGELTVFNRTDSSKKFSAGTALFSPGKLKFVFDEEVKVASKTPDLASGIDRWGEVKAPVTASDIGTQYNIDADSLFTLENTPTTVVLAKNQLAFLGGTSRQITVVSKEDQEKLFSDLAKELNQKAKEELEGKISMEENLALETMTTEIKVKKFDHEAQEEVNDLTLNLTIENRILVLKKDDLLQLALNILSSGEIDRMEIDKKRSQFKVLTPVEGDPLEFDTQIEIALRPKINSEEIIKNIKGNSFGRAQKYLSGLESVKTVKIKTLPGVFVILSWLPFKKENIILSFITE